MQSSAGLLHEVRCEKRNVLPPVSKWRKIQREHTQPVEEVQTKPAFFGFPPQIPVRGGDNPDVDATGGFIADAFELPLLKHAQQLRLKIQRDFTDLVKEQAFRHQLAGIAPCGREWLL